MIGMAQGPGAQGTDEPLTTLPSTTRLILKNLPKTITVDKLRSLFASHGQVTDVQLKYNGTTGAFRGFGFIGFRSETEAAKAQAYFHNTYVGASKISVEPCSTLRGEGGHRNKKSSLKRSLHQDQVPSDQQTNNKPRKKKKEEEILEKCNQDPMFREFLESHRKTTGWTNDTLITELERAVGTTSTATVAQTPEIETIVHPPVEKKLKKSKKSPALPQTPKPETPNKKKKKRRRSKKSQSPISYFTVKLRDLPQSAKKKDIKQFFDSLNLVPKSIRFPPNDRGFAYVGFSTEAERTTALSKNKSWLFGNKITVIKSYQKPETTSGAPEAKWTAQSKTLAEETEGVDETGRIFLRNLSYSTNEEEIRELFSKYGPITEVHLPLDRLSRQIKGFGFITFMLPEHATAAMAELDGSIFQGRMLHLLPSKPPTESEDSPASQNPDAKSSFKKAKDAKTKKTAGSSHNWNSLFLGQNAIAAVVAEKYGVSREELLLGNSGGGERDSTSAAVRMALAETEIVDETRNFLIENGVCLEAFDDDSTERSRTTFLIKNLPASTTVEQLVELYSKFGEIGRVVLPPSGVTGIMEFLEPAEARAAFKKTAYTNFRGTPLYLEWAPVGTFGTGTKAPGISKSTQSSTTAQPPSLMNIQLEKLENVPEIEKSEKSIASEIGVPEPLLEAKDSNSNPKLLVRNVPFQATQSEVLQLFKTFGEIKACRLPLKTDGSGDHRGFGFVEFLTKSDSKRALETLGKSTHLYGRRLVIEYARGTETVEQLRTKTARQFDLQERSGTGGGSSSSTKKQITRYFSAQKAQKSKTKQEEDEDEAEEMEDES